MVFGERDRSEGGGRPVEEVVEVGFDVTVVLVGEKEKGNPFELRSHDCGS